MRKKIFLFTIASMIFSLVAYGNTSSEVSTSAPKTITDLAGNVIKIPAAKDIKHVIIISPPVTSILLEVIPDKDMITGLNPKAFVYSNANVMAKLFPQYANIDTTFVGKDFSINQEALLQLNPDVILYYGDVQRKGLKNIGVPIVNLFSPKLTDPKDVTIAWHNLLREIFAADHNESMTAEWKRSDEKVAKLLARRKGEKKRALWIFSNMSGKLVVAGSSSFDAYAESFLEKAGIVNVAADTMKGTAEIDMEQVYQWNPDMIFIFQNVPAQAYRNNTITGQDWSLLDAWKNKAIYDIPQTTYSWAAPCADSPLMPLWLISKAYPELLSEENFRTELGGYYERLHNITLTENDISSILSDRSVK